VPGRSIGCRSLEDPRLADPDQTHCLGRVQGRQQQAGNTLEVLPVLG
jgi:hypothetical protein